MYLVLSFLKKCKLTFIRAHAHFDLFPSLILQFVSSYYSYMKYQQLLICP